METLFKVVVSDKVLRRGHEYTSRYLAQQIAENLTNLMINLKVKFPCTIHIDKRRDWVLRYDVYEGVLNGRKRE